MPKENGTRAYNLKQWLIITNIKKAYKQNSKLFGDEEATEEAV